MRASERTNNFEIPCPSTDLLKSQRQPGHWNCDANVNYFRMYLSSMWVHMLWFAYTELRWKCAIHPLFISKCVAHTHSCVEKSKQNVSALSREHNVIYSCLRCSIIIVFMCHRSFPFSCISLIITWEHSFPAVLLFSLLLSRSHSLFLGSRSHASLSGSFCSVLLLSPSSSSLLFLHETLSFFSCVSLDVHSNAIIILLLQ